MIDILKQVVFRTNNYFLIIFVVFLYSCNTNDTKYSVKYFSDEITNNKKEYAYINNKILELRYFFPYSLTGYRAKQIFYLINKNDSSIALKDERFATYLWKFVRKEYLEVCVYDDVIRYSYSDIRNENLNGYHVLYLKKEIKNGSYFEKLVFDKYKFHETGNIPKEIDGWVYHIEGNWFIQSPFPEK